MIGSLLGLLVKPVMRRASGLAPVVAVCGALAAGAVGAMGWLTLLLLFLTRWAPRGDFCSPELRQGPGASAQRRRGSEGRDESLAAAQEPPPQGPSSLPRSHYAPASHYFTRPLHFDFAVGEAVALAPLSPNLRELPSYTGASALPKAAAASVLPKSYYKPAGFKVQSWPRAAAGARRAKMPCHAAARALLA
jgi:hypothetical protein